MKPTLIRRRGRGPGHGGGDYDDEAEVAADSSVSAGAGRKERTTAIRAWAVCAMSLSLLMAYGLGRQHPCPSLQPASKIRTKKSSSKAPPPPLPWWEPVVQANRAKPEGLRVYASPVTLAGERYENDLRLLQLLKLLGAGPSTKPGAPRPGVIVDIGLPKESVTFAKSGYLVQAFEARLRGYMEVSEALQQLEAPVRARIQLHHTALSNYTGITEIFDANDSSSLLRGAVVNGRIEEEKFEKAGKRVETVPLTTLDRHFRSLAASQDDDAAPAPAASVVGIQIDTQGVEPEIFMGAESILSDPATRLRVIVMEYCAPFRPFDELSTGIHLLIGLGYTCYYEQLYNFNSSMVITPGFGFSGDFYCTHQPLKAGVAGSR
jgi:hypothetical protein